MKRFIITVLLLALAVPALAKTHHEVFNVPCSELWPAVKDTLRNSGKYGIIGIDNNEMTASYNMGGNLTGKRINSVVLNNQGGNCDLQVQTAFSGLVNNDAGDFKKRVDESLAKLKAAGAAKPAAEAATPGAPSATEAAAATPAKPAAAQVAVASTPDGAEVSIDGAFVGNTPSSIELTPGDHTVAVHKKGFKEWARQIKVTGGNISLRAELEPVAP